MYDDEKNPESIFLQHNTVLFGAVAPKSVFDEIEGSANAAFGTLEMKEYDGTSVVRTYENNRKLFYEYRG